MRARARYAAGLVAFLLTAGLPAAAGAAPITLRDGAARVVIDPANQDGLKEWRLGAQHAKKQWWWYRVGDSGPEASIDTLEMQSAITSDTDGDGRDDTLVVTWRHPEGLFHLEMSWRLTGSITLVPGYLQSTLDQQIQLTSLTPGAQDITLFLYVDMDLGGGSIDSLGHIDCGDAGLGTCNIATEVYQSDGGDDPDTTYAAAMLTRAFDVNAFSDFTAAFDDYPYLLDQLNDTTDTELYTGPKDATQDDLSWAASWTWSYPNGDKTLDLAVSQRLTSESQGFVPPYPGGLADYFEQYVSSGLLFGTGSGFIAGRRVKIMGRMLMRADQDPDGSQKRTCRILGHVLRRSDGLPKPPDLVQGPGLQQFNKDLGLTANQLCSDGKPGDPINPPGQ